jgi:peptidoglycan/xylan/chitin deacetylase (PgdA/CDA1 family)
MIRAHIQQIIFGLVIVFLSLTAGFSQGHERTKIRSVAFTFDDLPSTHGNAPYVIDLLIEKLVENNVPAIGFVNEAKLYTDGLPDNAKIGLLKQWLDAKLELGNHSFSHIAIDDVTLAMYKADVLKGEKITKQLLLERGKMLSYYRHTQLRTGPTTEIKKELDDFLKEYHYTVAPVTIDNNDYIFANVYQQAKTKHDTAVMRYVATEYLKYMADVVQHFEALSKKFLGYELKQVLLLHANALNADYLGKLIEVFRQRGYNFISLDEALKDPAYSLKEAVSKRGLSWLHRWMLAKNIPLDPEPDTPAGISALYQRYSQ